MDPTAAGVPTIDATTEPGDGATRSGPGVTPLVAPLPFRNSQIGWGGVLMVGLIHRFDPDTSLKPSTGAVMGFASENGFRYQLTRNYPMQRRLDYAWGRDGGLLYFLVGEAF